MLHAHRWGRLPLVGVVAATMAGAASGAGLIASGGGPSGAPASASGALTAAVTAGGPAAPGAPGVPAGSGVSSGTSAGGRDLPDARCTAADVGTARQALQTALAQRATALTRMAGRVSAAKHLPSADAAALAAIISAERTSVDGGGITGLQAVATADTTCAQLAATAKQMVSDFRVYLLVGRQVNITVCSTGSLAAVQRATAEEPVIQARIARAASRGVPVGAAQQAFTDLQQQLSTATAELSGIDIAQVLAQVPSDVPGDEAMLEADSATMEQADAALHAARQDLQAIRQDLGATRGSAGSGSAGSGSAGSGSAGSGSAGSGSAGSGSAGA